ncbi:MAG: response regulator transcription factor [Planctomycetes bacterium]|nr:response regulator transcription factor [Planctomycetota bacterium]
MLAEQGQRRYDDSLALAVTGPDQVEVWQWNAEQGQSMPKMLPPRSASAIVAARLASDAYRLAPEDFTVRRLYLGTLLEAAVLQAGLDQPLPEALGAAAEVANQIGPDALDDVLQHSLDTGHVPAATAAAAILGRSGLSELAQSDSAAPRPLVAATRHADRRLRFAAVNAILTINPQQPFAGASFVTDALRYFVATTGTRRALAAAPRQDEARRIGALLTETGYQADVALDDRSLFQQAQSVPDYELLLVDSHLPGRPIEELLQQLARDTTTGAIPVGVIASPDDLPRAHQAIKHHPRAMVFVRPVDPAGITMQVQALAEQLGPLVPTPAERSEHARRSLEWLARLAAQPRSIYNLQPVDRVAERALYVPELTGKAMEVLANRPSAKGQLALLELASRPTQPLDLRQQAAAAFDRSVGRHGILLTSPEILRQYERYNRSATLDEGTQQVLGQLLDTLESRVAAPRTVPVSGPSPQESPAAASR